MTTYLIAPGEPIELGDLKLEKAQSLAQAAQSDRLAFVTLVECRRDEAFDNAEVIVLEVEVEVGQHTAHDIRRIERVAVEFFSGDRRIPEVVALREDFPQVPHLNLRWQELPRSLCLYDEPYEEVKLYWTAASFIERIRNWLAKTARGELHAPDQPLEPLLIGSVPYLVLPPNMVESLATNPSPRFSVYEVKSRTGHVTYIAGEEAAGRFAPNELRCIAIVLQGRPQTHGIIRQLPQNLKQLHDFLQPAQIDAISSVREQLKHWQHDMTSLREILSHQLIIVVILPKTRTADGDVEASDIYAFVTVAPLHRVGAEIDAWQFIDGVPGAVLGVDPRKDGEQVELVLLNPTAAFTSKHGARSSGITHLDSQSIAAIGLGALGSHVFLNLVRMGFASWTLVDKDILLPHNLARHALESWAIGYSKSFALSGVANHMLNDQQATKPFAFDVLNPGEDTTELGQALEEASTILDMTASVPAARALACDHGTSARRISLFLNPAGTDLVLLAENTSRSIPLDLLEMQYYRLLVDNDGLHNHLYVDQRRQRYARSCRDVSAMIPQDLVALHAGLGSRALRSLLPQPDAHIAIWQAHPDTLTVTQIKGEASVAVVEAKNGWTIIADSWLIEKLHVQRQKRLPNETGGVLVGSIDLQRRRIYVVLSIPSPRDSVEWPTMYIRGSEGLQEQIRRIDQITAGQLAYIGEWHSHPRGCPPTPSSDDQRVLQWLTNERAVDGLPGFMAIVADDTISWHVSTG
jgi:hypothetical protein